MSKALITMYAGEHEAFRPLTYGSIAGYAELHGYELIEAEPQSDDIYPWWWKLPAMSDALDAFDIVVWMDCDILVLKPRADVANRLHSRAFIGVASDMRCDAVSALFVMRAGEQSQTFLEDAWSQRYDGRYPYWDLGDQGAIQRLIKDPRYVDGVVHLGYHWLGPEGFPLPTSRMIHACRQTAEGVPQRAARLAHMATGLRTG